MVGVDARTKRKRKKCKSVFFFVPFAYNPSPFLEEKNNTLNIAPAS